MPHRHFELPVSASPKKFSPTFFSSILPMAGPQMEEKRTRSRGGCVSCKHLRIKCSEDKPTCEYCHFTKRTCEYPARKPLKKDLKVSKKQRKTPKASSKRSSHYSRVSPFFVLSTLRSTPGLEPRSECELTQDLSHASKNWNLCGDLTRDLVLTQTTSMLGISRFELRLLQFFDQGCTKLLSFGWSSIANAWRHGVPRMFLESEVTRSAMLSFSAMTMLSEMDLNLVQRMDAKEDERSMTHMYNMDISSPNNMFVKSTSYFLDAVAKKRDLLNYASSPDFQDSHIAKELTVSGILIFAYLGVDPNRMVPLIDFTRQSTDFIQISRGVRHTIVTCAPIIYQSDIKGALLLKGIDDLKSPKFKSCKYPIIASLREELENSVTDEISSNSSHEYSVLRETIHTLMHAIYGCKFYKLPVPLFRFMMKIPDEFRELLYQRNEFSLRLLFRYASLNAISGFYFHERRNMWKDHMIWYAQSYKLSKIDKQLYYLAVEKNFIWEDSARFYEFDPAVEYDRLRNSQTT